MSETWTNLLSGVVGAIVGGLASLGGTMLVNKQQMATNARMRLYDQLLPSLALAINDVWTAEDQITELLAAVRRASAIAGRADGRTLTTCRNSGQSIRQKPKQKAKPGRRE